MEMPQENEVCSICGSRVQIPCQANCSHWFCGSCILRSWNHRDAPRNCPICGRLITSLVTAQAPPMGDQMADVAEVLDNIERYNRRYRQPPNGLIQRREDRLSLIARLLRIMMLIATAHFIFSMVVPVVYFISPVDLIPQGWLGTSLLHGDLIVLCVRVLVIAAVYQAFLRGGAHD